MRLVLMRHLWGVEEAWETSFPRIKAAGYAGIECPPPEPTDRSRFQDLLAAHGLAYIAGISTQGDDVQAHVDSFRRQLEQAAELSPLLVSCHDGRDYWSRTESEQFYAAALAAEAAAGMAVAHETHRGRILFNPWITRDLLQTFPDLQLCCDLSHWVCVCERLLQTETDIIRQCAERCLHIHARVGFEEGPQVPDVRAPEYREHLEAHEAWWDMIWEAQAARGMQASTLTPEFGPPRYQHTLPFTGVPVADVWDISNWQAKRQAFRFERRYGTARR
jgi:sugar phosphate isomerase/epimerase